jgi:hypothetical protein
MSCPALEGSSSTGAGGELLSYTSVGVEGTRMEETRERLAEQIITQRIDCKYFIYKLSKTFNHMMIPNVTCDN